MGQERMTRVQALAKYHDAIRLATHYTEQVGEIKAKIQAFDQAILDKATAEVDAVMNSRSREMKFESDAQRNHMIWAKARQTKESNWERQELIAACQWARQQSNMLSNLAQALAPLAFQPPPIRKETRL